jgi:hypothetical protein
VHRHLGSVFGLWTLVSWSALDEQANQVTKVVVVEWLRWDKLIIHGFLIALAAMMRLP